MLKSSDLKVWLHRPDQTQLDKLLLVLATFDGPCSVKEIRSRAKEGGLKVNDRWNPSTVLGRSAGRAINTSEGWELTDAGRGYLRKMGVTSIRQAAAQVAHDLRAELTKIKNTDTQAFVEEAIACFEHGFYRSAVIMSWVGAIHLLQTHVVANHLAAFNVEASRIDNKWKPAKTTDDIGRMKEIDFLDRLVGISVLSKNVKSLLGKCLDLRNGCGHPTAVKIGPNTVADHLERLLLNVFAVFA